ncbi:succinylglutamate desuccinylase [Candidatus Pantoea carbekii]|uniref:succinylglutamate desuccinylase n=1 Tax=Candidatus Pantoea carbekii TaxID=1235990 RepID=UPI00061877C8|nr:succinylglutamate desuccinylase [Candidatus Pantoea carbekii]AKC32604.1 succinylglutamate desuccinylase astE [Candidatus Pantoea carbekii]
MHKIISKLLNDGLQDITFPIEIQANWLAEGVLQLIPKVGFNQAIIVSAGIHGNETAPVELLASLLLSLSKKKLFLRCALLIIFGNLAAMRIGKRYIHYDMNRLFCGLCNSYLKSIEGLRAAVLERTVNAFFNTLDLCNNHHISVYHFDIHSTIRNSRFSQFALIPYHINAYNKFFFDFLKSCELDAIVQHTVPNGTFSYYVSKRFGIQSCTLELGTVQPFGQNALYLFQATEFALKALISDNLLLETTKTSLKFFTIKESIIKTHSSFRLTLSSLVENFTKLESGQIIAYEKNQIWRANDTACWILFPNPNVALGLRAALLLEERLNIADMYRKVDNILT